MIDVQFSSMNPYQAMQVIIADDPQSLIGLLSQITTPIKIVAIVPYGTRQAAYIMGDIRITKTRSKPKEK